MRTGKRISLRRFFTGSLLAACLCILLAPFSMLVVSCGNGTGSGKVFSDEGHPANWASHLTIGTDSFHGTAIMQVPSADNGTVLFVRHCTPCHGNDASGKIGPNIQGAPASLISFAVTIPIMRGHSILSQSDIGDISGYLALLKSGAPPVIGVIDPAVCTQCHALNLDGGIAKVSCFACHNGPDGSFGHPPGWLSSKDDPLHFHGVYGKEFVTGCTACHGADLRGLVGPSCFVCHDGTRAPILQIPLPS